MKCAARDADVKTPAPSSSAGELIQDLETIKVAANKTTVQEALARCEASDAGPLRQVLIVAKGDWRRAMISKRIKALEAEAPPAVLPAELPPPMKTILGLKATPVRVKIAKIQNDPDHRSDHDAGQDAALVESIRTVGLLQPVILFDSEHGGFDYHCADGRRRLLALSTIGQAEVDAWVFPPASEDVRARVAAVCNLERRDLNPLEECLAVARLLESLDPKHKAATWADVSPVLVDQAAALLGRSAAWVRDRAYLSRLCPAVRDLVATRQLPLAHAREIAKLAGQDDQICEATGAAGIFGWDLKDGKIVPDKFHRDHEARGDVRIRSIGDVRKSVLERLSTLRGTPWNLDVPFAGHVACTGCPDNSTHTTLFNVDGDDAAPEARCLNLPCYMEKMKQAEKALAESVKSLKGVKSVAPTAAGIKSAGVGPGAAQIAVPDYLKPSTVARKLAQARGTAPKPKKDQPQPREIPWEKQPENMLSEALRKRNEACAAMVARALVEKPERLKAYCLALLSKTYRRHSPNYSNPTAAQAKAIRPVLEKVKRATAVDIDNLIGDLDIKVLESSLRPWLTPMLAGLLDINLPREPVLADFEPKAKEGAKGKRNPKATMDSQGYQGDGNCVDCSTPCGDGDPDE